ncbi:MAG: FtsX-like permease family protein, partial [Acidiferrobacterales bacterium]|nr:FtsX-like permease family protein [Acidiferrobacterales bacterium]
TPPSNTHLKFDFLASLETLRSAGANLDNGQITSDMRTYLVLQAPASVDVVKPQIQKVFAQSSKFLAKAEPVLSPLKSLHLGGVSAASRTSLSGDLRYVYIFGCIALLVLLIACINFTNLSTAQAIRRSQEVSVRKVVGAGRVQLIQQFLGETFLYSLVAVLASVVLAQAALPAFNALVGKTLQIPFVGPGSIVPWLGLLWLGTALLAGIYPAFMLSGFKPMTTLKNKARAGSGGVVLRRSLVVFQFTVSIALIVGLFVIQRQLDYLQQQNLDMQPEQMILLGTQEDMAASPETFKNAVRNISGITDATLSNFPESIGFPIVVEGGEAQTYTSTVLVDADFLQTMRLNVTTGRPFDPARTADLDGAVLINETAAREFGWTDPLGKQIERFSLLSGEMVTSEVIGVVEDFPTRSLKYAQQAIVLVLNDDATYFRDDLNVLARVDAGEIPQVLASLQKLWPQYLPARPFEYQFLDTRFANLYRAERQLGLLFATFAGLAVLIACLGLFGLAVYTTERRTKEIGIRKVLGASVFGLVRLLSKEFALLVLAAFLIATPLAYFAMERWLADFAYRIDLSWWIFLLAGITALGTALLTVSYQAIKTALADPVKSLRYE